MTTHRHTTHHYWRLTAPTSKLCKDVRCNQWWWDSLPKTNSSSLKIGGCKTICLLGNPICSGAEISFREGNPVTSSCTKIIVNHGFATCGLGKDSAILSILWNQNMREWKHSVLSFYHVYNHAVLYVYNRISEHAILFELQHIDITSIFTWLPSFEMRLQATTPMQTNCAREFPGWSLEWPSWNQTVFSDILRLISAIAGKENKNTNISKDTFEHHVQHTYLMCSVFGFKSDASSLVSLGSEPFRLWIFRKFHLKTQANQVKSFNLLRGNFSVKKGSRSAVGSCDI